MIDQSRARLANGEGLTQSSQLRTRGNEAFGSAYLEGVGRDLRKAKLEQSSSKYFEALSAAGNDDDRATALKAIAVASARLALHHTAPATPVNEASLKTHLHFFKLTVTHASRASGAQCKPLQWREVVESQLTEFVELCLAKSRELEMADRVEMLRAYIGILGKSPSLRGTAALALGSTLFKSAVCELEGKNFHACRGMLEHAAQATRQVQRDLDADVEAGELLARSFTAVEVGNSLAEMAAELDEDIQHHLRICESVRCRETGEQLQRRVLEEEEELQVDMMWEVVDWYKQAIIQTKDLDIENETRANGQLALAFDKILKDTVRARHYLTATIQLGLSMEGARGFQTEEWWRLCQARLKQIIDSEQVETDPELLKKLEPQLKKIRAAAKPTVEGSDAAYPDKLLQLLYAEFQPKYPPDVKDATGAVTSDKSAKRSLSDGDLKDKATLKKAMHAALRCYASDKNEAQHKDEDGNEFGREWHLLCVEIQKHLNAAYFAYCKEVTE